MPLTQSFSEYNNNIPEYKSENQKVEEPTLIKTLPNHNHKAYHRYDTDFYSINEKSQKNLKTKITSEEHIRHKDNVVSLLFFLFSRFWN